MRSQVSGSIAKGCTLSNIQVLIFVKPAQQHMKRNPGMAFQPSAAQVESSIDRLKQERWGGATYIRNSALSVCEMARLIRNPLLEANALLLLGRAFTTLVYPEEVFASMLQAEKIFQAHQRGREVAQSRVVTARALFDMGRDRDAIACARAALQESNLCTEYRTAAYVVAALSHGHLGELDQSLGLVINHALPLSMTPGAMRLRPHALRAAATLLLQLKLAEKAPELWRGLPGAYAAKAKTPTMPDVLNFVEAAERAMPQGITWSLLEMIKMVIKGMQSKDEAPLKGLSALAAGARKTDPPSACWALFCKSLVLQFRGAQEEALESLREALLLAKHWKMTLAAGDILLQKARIYEAQSNPAAALKTYKGFWLLRIRSTQQELVLPGTDRPWHEAMRPDASVRLVENTQKKEKMLAMRASNYIDRNLGEKLTVNEIVNHCRTSRLTLETSFKQIIGNSIARHIKQRRLENAAHSLRNNNCTIKEVAQSVGYRSTAQFSKDFRVRFGISAQEWRRQS